MTDASWSMRPKLLSLSLSLIHTPNLRGAESYQSVAGGSVATRCRWLSRADQAAAFCDAASCSARRHLSRLRRFLRPLEPTDLIERDCACERVNMHMYNGAVQYLGQGVAAEKTPRSIPPPGGLGGWRAPQLRRRQIFEKNLEQFVYDF